jgi:hypothetical protein
VINPFARGVHERDATGDGSVVVTGTQVYV